MTPALLTLLDRVAATEVRDEAVADGPVDVTVWNQLVALARAERVEPQLARAIARGRLAATEQQRAEADALHQQAMATALRLDRFLLEIAERFAAASIPFVVLKGTAAAHLDYPDPAARAYGDVDVLVPAGLIDRAAACLGATGAERAHDEPRPGFDRRFSKGMSYRMASGFELDVHRTLVLGPFGLAIDLDDLFAGREAFEIGGRGFDALDRSRRFVHACLHATLGRARPRLVPLLDVAMTAPHTVGDLASAVALVRRWQADAPVLAAVEAARDRLGWTPSEDLAGWLERLEPTARQKRWLAGYRGSRRSSAVLTLSAIEAISGWRDRVDYGLAVVWPSQASLAGTARRLDRGVRALSRRPGR